MTLFNKEGQVIFEKGMEFASLLACRISDDVFYKELLLFNLKLITAQFDEKVLTPYLITGLLKAVEEFRRELDNPEKIKEIQEKRKNRIASG